MNLKKIVLVIVLLSLLAFTACDTSLVSHDHDGDGVADHAPEDHHDEHDENEHHDEEVHHDNNTEKHLE